MTRGIVVGARIDTTGGFKMTGSVGIEDVLGWVLYWDKIKYAGIGKQGASITGNQPQDILYLESTGVFSTEVVDIDSLGDLHLPAPSDGMQIFGLASNQFAVAAAAARIHLSKQLSADAGSIWTVGQSGGKGLLLPSSGSSEDLIDVRLVNCLPVPALGTPFDDILNFKDKHQDELDDLRQCLDQLRENILSSSDSKRATDIAVKEVERSLSNIRAALKGSKIKWLSETFSLYTKSPSFGWWTAMGGMIAWANGIPFPEGVAYGAATDTLVQFFKRPIIGGQNLPEELSDFAYVYEAAKELGI